MKKQRHYVITKRLICDLVDGECSDELGYTSKMTPDCKDCRYFKEWKESGLDTRSYFNKYVRQ